MGFVSRMIPFAYSYGDELVAEIKDAIDDGQHTERVKPQRKMPHTPRKQVTIAMHPKLVKEMRRMADARSKSLGQLGIRLLQNYHALVRAHALLNGRKAVAREDMDFLRAIDSYVSVTPCQPLNGE